MAAMKAAEELASKMIGRMDTNFCQGSFFGPELAPGLAKHRRPGGIGTIRRHYR